MSRLMEYFNEVDKNAVMRAAHQFEPVDSMTRFGLTSTEQDAVMSGNILDFAHAAGVIPSESSKLQVIHIPNTDTIYLPQD